MSKRKTVKKHSPQRKWPVRERISVGVVGGDRACINSLVRHWTSHPASKIVPVGMPAVALADIDNKRTLTILLNPEAVVSPWPGGPFIWLFPERGPSAPELAEMRLMLNSHKSFGQKIHILLCLPEDVDLLSANTDLDKVSETLKWNVDSKVKIYIEAVWLAGTGKNTIGKWLAALGKQHEGY